MQQHLSGRREQPR